MRHLSRLGHLLDRLRGARPGWRHDDLAPQQPGGTDEPGVAEGKAAPAVSEPTSDDPPLPDHAKLDVASDYRPFLRKNVPAELKRLGLRRAWASDPAIASFRGFGDYDWDTNAPGYGWLRPADAVMAAATVLGQAERKLEEESVVEAEVDADALDDAEESAPDDQPREDEIPDDRSSA